jgi:dynamin 1-like protein
MDNIIQMMNEIQMTLGEAQLKYDPNLPRIAVIGAQSSGKSSVLESIVGIDFLPRGTGIVTRCPLILQLIYENIKEAYATFEHRAKEEYKDFNEVRKEIIERTKELAGEGKKIVNAPIYLNIYSQDVPTLTLIDLPGFTKLTMDNQEKGMSEEIEKLVMKYIKKDNTIILAISPANNDIANSDGLTFANKVDPERKRTFGVMTKIDIMDKGTNALDYLSGKEYHLEQGFIGVKCRSQEDNDNGKSIKIALEEELEFFANHPIYKDIAEQQGTSMLAKKLSMILSKHIEKNLPMIEKMIEDYVKEDTKILHDLGEEIN